MSVPPASAQNQGKRDLKAQQKVEEEAEKRQELLEEVQPMADRFAEAMVTRKYSDSLVQGYVSSLGQSLVPPDSPASLAGPRPPGRRPQIPVKEGKQATHWTRLSCHRFRANEVRLQLSVLAYNLGNLWRRLGLPNRIKSWSLTSLQHRLIKTSGHSDGS